MTRYIAFLRAINVGGHNVKMAQLCQLFEELGFSNVETFIASGNVVFESSARSVPALEKKIEKHLQQALGYEVATFIRTYTELAKVAEYQPFPDSITEQEGSTMYVSFFRSALDQETHEKVLALETEVDQFHIQGRELYWWCRKNLMDSQVSGPQLSKALSLPSTMRNMKTVKKMAAKFEGR